MTNKLYAVATDSFMSGWGEAPGRSLIALECGTREQLDRAIYKLEQRPEMKRVRVNLALPKLRAGDHLSVMTPDQNPVWFA